MLDLGSGLGYSTLWIASVLDADARVVGIDADASHVREVSEIADRLRYEDKVSFIAGHVADVLPTPFDMIHDNAWFAKAPDHLEVMVGMLRAGGLLTMSTGSC